MNQDVKAEVIPSYFTDGQEILVKEEERGTINPLLTGALCPEWSVAVCERRCLVSFLCLYVNQ